MKKKNNRDTIAIKIWMLRNDINQTRIAKALNISRSLVSETINGAKNSRKVLRYLINNGCPTDVLDLPAFMTNQEAA
jgi:predicted XRE-type DNA-binding protein